MKAHGIRLIVKHNHKVNVYPLSATVNSPNEPAGRVFYLIATIEAERDNILR